MLVSQLFLGTLRVIQNLRKYFYGTDISLSFALPAPGSFPVIVIYDFNNSKFTILTKRNYSCHLDNIAIKLFQILISIFH